MDAKEKSNRELAEWLRGLAGYYDRQDMIVTASDFREIAKRLEGQWLPIESAPRDGTLKLFCTRNGQICIAPDVEEQPLTAGQKLQMHKASGDWPNAGYLLAWWQALPPPPDSARSE